MAFSAAATGAKDVLCNPDLLSVICRHMDIEERWRAFVPLCQEVRSAYLGKTSSTGGGGGGRGMDNDKDKDKDRRMIISVKLATNCIPFHEVQSIYCQMIFAMRTAVTAYSVYVSARADLSMSLHQVLDCQSSFRTKSSAMAGYVHAAQMYDFEWHKMISVLTSVRRSGFIHWLRTARDEICGITLTDVLQTTFCPCHCIYPHMLWSNEVPATPQRLLLLCYSIGPVLNTIAENRLVDCIINDTVSFSRGDRETIAAANVVYDPRDDLAQVLSRALHRIVPNTRNKASYFLRRPPALNPVPIDLNINYHIVTCTVVPWMVRFFSTFNARMHTSVWV